MREKLIELCGDLQELPCCSTYEGQADYLIANGITVTDNNVGGKWIPVTERLPEHDGQYLCNYHFGTHRDMTFTRVLDYYATDKVPHFQHTLGDTTMKVTHWMPLPKPPKGE